MTFAVVLCLLLVTAAGFAVVASREISRAGRAERDTAARHRFLAAFDTPGAGSARAPAELLIETFETVAARTAAPRGALRPAARLRADLGLSDADVEDVALLVTARCEAQLPHARDLDALVRQVATVEEFVQFLTPFVDAPRLARAA